MEKSEKAESITFYIHECEKLIHKKGHEIAKKYNLTIDQYHLLVILNFSKVPPTIGEVAKKLCKAQNTMSERISRLEEKNLIERTTDTKDRRIIRVRITYEGKKLVEKIRKERSSVFVLNAISKMKEDEADILMKQLENLYMYLEKEV